MFRGGCFFLLPPFNLPAGKVRLRLDKADVFLVLQTAPGLMFSGGDPGAQFQVLNRLAVSILGIS
jgi:hypothetical protein